MHIKSIVAGAAFALIAGVGSVSADELSVADTAGDTGTPFAMLNGIATSELSVQELAATRGAADMLRKIKIEDVTGDTAGTGNTSRFIMSRTGHHIILY